MSNIRSRLPVLGRCRGNHKQCDSVTESIQNEFNLQYWSLKKVDQDNCLLRSIKVSKKNVQSTNLDYRYFVFGLEVCSQMFIKTLGYKTKSRIEYLFSKLKQTDNLNSLKVPIDGRKNNRVKSREHGQQFLEELYKFVNSFVSNKKKNHLIIENYKPIDIFKKLCNKLGYKIVYEDNNIKIIRNIIQSNEQLKSQHFIKSNDQLNQNSNSQFSIKLNEQNISQIDDCNDESMTTIINEAKLYINEMSNSVSNNLINNDNNQSQLINQQSNSQQFTIQNNNNFISFSQILDPNINNFVIKKNTSFKVNISNQNVNVSSNLIETSNLNRSSDRSSNKLSSNLNKSSTENNHKSDLNEICSFSFFVRFLKKNKFEFR